MSSGRFTRADVDLSDETFVFRPFRRGRQSIRYARRTWDSKFGVSVGKGGPSDRQDRRSASLRQSYIRHQLISDCPDASSSPARNDRISFAREESWHLYGAICSLYAAETSGDTHGVFDCSFPGFPDGLSRADRGGAASGVIRRRNDSLSAIAGVLR